MPDHPQYRIERRDDGDLRLYRGEELVDSDRQQDPDSLADIERWGTLVAWAEDYTAIQRWDRDHRDGRWHTLIGVAYRYVTFQLDNNDEPVTVWDELDSTNWATRHIEAVAGRYTVAAALSEAIAARDTGGVAAVRDYEQRYGVVPEAPYPPDVVEQLTTVTGREFEGRWAAARNQLAAGAQA